MKKVKANEITIGQIIQHPKINKQYKIVKIFPNVNLNSENNRTLLMNTIDLTTNKNIDLYFQPNELVEIIK